MKKQSPEQYIKCLTALSLAVTASAGAQSAVAAPAEPSVKAPQPSANLEALAEAVVSENQAQPASCVPGCTGWPESTYIRRAQLRDGQLAERQSGAVEADSAREQHPTVIEPRHGVLGPAGVDRERRGVFEPRIGPPSRRDVGCPSPCTHLDRWRGGGDNGPADMYAAVGWKLERVAGMMARARGAGL